MRKPFLTAVCFNGIISKEAFSTQQGNTVNSLNAPFLCETGIFSFIIIIRVKKGKISLFLDHETFRSVSHPSTVQKVLVIKSAAEIPSSV